MLTLIDSPILVEVGLVAQVLAVQVAVDILLMMQVDSFVQVAFHLVANQIR